MFEHRVYLASWGFFVAAAALAERATARWLADRAWVSVLALGLLLGGWAAALHQRNAVWETREALWRDALEKTPAAPRARAALGDALVAQGRPEEAVREYQAALQGAAGLPRQEAQVLVSLGAAQLEAGRPEEARRSFERAVALRPEDDLALVNLAALAGGAGDAPAAEALARRALRVNPAQPGAWLVLGNAALERGDWAAALDGYGRALALDPDRGEAHYGRALALAAQDRTGEACGALREALAATLRPEYRAAVTGLSQEHCR
jgi:tetratricopeptide (TPR) repeat protein